MPEPSALIVVATDGNAQYRDALAKLYCEPCIDYGQVIKQRKEKRLVGLSREITVTSQIFCNLPEPRLLA